MNKNNVSDQFSDILFWAIPSYHYFCNALSEMYPAQFSYRAYALLIAKARGESLAH
jgi:hypothetical protein